MTNLSLGSSPMTKIYEIRDPIHGFIQLNDWEREIVDHFVFQRLRRIRQLGLTDMVYPGAMHTRFEHSLGVMHLATMMFDAIVARRREFLKSELRFTKGGLKETEHCFAFHVFCTMWDMHHFHTLQNL